MTIEAGRFSKGRLAKFTPDVRVSTEMMTQGTYGSGQTNQSYPFENVPGLHHSTNCLGQFRGFAG
jgi:hypothetical protein